MLDRVSIVADGTPIHVQLRQQVLGLIGDGTLRPGDRLPTMRQVAQALKVNLGTVQQAWDGLERDGALVALRGRGTFVAERPAAEDPALAEARLEALARRTVAKALAHGLEPGRVGLRLVEMATDRKRAASESIGLPARGETEP